MKWPKLNVERSDAPPVRQAAAATGHSGRSKPLNRSHRERVLRLALWLRVELPEPSLGPSALGLLATLHREGPMSAIKLAKAERLQP